MQTLVEDLVAALVEFAGFDSGCDKGLDQICTSYNSCLTRRREISEPNLFELHRERRANMHLEGQNTGFAGL